jgi:retron-type reverse transcriptase
MKRRGNLWPRLVSFEYLMECADRARRGKRFRPDVARFEFQRERELLRLQQELTGRSYRPSPGRSFVIREPKPRQIVAAAYRDRVVQHALTGILEPIFEPTFVFDSYACRVGKGTHAAVDRCQFYSRRFAYVWKTDIRGCFPSLDHEILAELLARKIKDPNVLWLAGLIIAHSPVQEVPISWFPGDTLFTPVERRRGLPIGNQTSQFFANVYLDPLDHFVKEQLGVRGYVRYVDDMLLFDDDKRRLHAARRSVVDFLVRLRLRLHPRKNAIFPVTEGIRFLGYRVFPTHRLLAKENVWRFLRTARELQQAFAAGLISFATLKQRLESWNGHACHADTWLLRTRLFHNLIFQRGTAE